MQAAGVERPPAAGAAQGVAPSGVDEMPVAGLALDKALAHTAPAPESGHCRAPDGRVIAIPHGSALLTVEQSAVSEGWATADVAPP